MDVLKEIMEHIHAGHNFLLSGGAGSGKTHTLVGVIRGIVESYPSKHIACITYTNAAADEITRRVNHSNVTVSTIHDFLWDNIKQYQDQLRRQLAILVNDPECPIQVRGSDSVDEEYFFNPEIERIDYKEYLQISKGIVSHDEVILLAKAMFLSYPKLRRVVSDRNPIILIDEYQDTQKEVIEILLDMLSPKERIEGDNYALVGLFGDSMQSIYPNGVGDIDEYVTCENAHVKEVKMEGNRRNPQLIIELANKLRTDRIQQTHSEDVNAPNMNQDGSVKHGAIHFLYGDGSLSLDYVRHWIEENYGWDFKNTASTKELDLTHNLIAGRGGFPNLIDIYDGDPIIKYRDKVKKYIKDMGITEDFSRMSFGEVESYLSINYPDDESRWGPSNGKQRDFIASNARWYELAQSINYGLFSKVYVEKAQLIDDKKQDENDEKKKGTKRAEPIKHLYKLMQIIECYRAGRIGGFLRLTDMAGIRQTKDKWRINEAMEKLSHIDEMKIGDVIGLANDRGILLIDDKLSRYIDENSYVWERVIDLPFAEFRCLYDYLEGRTPFATQHKTKGTEFDHVFMLMDNGDWTQYNYNYLMSGTPKGKSEKPQERTNKLFYVCCTRAKEDLVMYYPSPQTSDLDKAREWFGEDNVILLS